MRITGLKLARHSRLNEKAKGVGIWEREHRACARGHKGDCTIGSLPQGSTPKLKAEK